MDRFRWGDLTKIAEIVGVTRGYLTHILHGRRDVGPSMADRLVMAAAILGYSSTAYDWQFPATTINPLFAHYAEGSGLEDFMR